MLSHSLIRLLCILVFRFSLSLAQSFYVAAPNTIRLGVEETVALAHDGANTQGVNLYLQDYPVRRNNFSVLAFDVASERSEIVTIRVTEQDLPGVDFTDSGVKIRVALVVLSGAFHKEVIIPVSTKSGYVFIQTDKPVYTPKQLVNIRIIPLTEKLLPSREEFKLQIRNPQNIIVEQNIFNSASSAWRRTFISRTFSFPLESLLGEWTVVALYGPQFLHNSSSTFELREYVLPTFSLRLETPNVILPDSEEIIGRVTAEYVYTKKVKGYATFKVGVKDQVDNIVYVGRTRSIELEDGVADFRFSTNIFKNHQEIGWFPELRGDTLIVEATVTDFASGNQEVVMSQKGKFSETPFVISFKRCLKDFKAGFISVIEADIYYVNGEPAPRIPVLISAVANGRDELNIETDRSVSDAEGRVTFFFYTAVEHSSVAVTLKTDDSTFGGNQATATYVQQKFISARNGFLEINRSRGTLRIGDVFSEDIYVEPPQISDIYYMVVSRGFILLMNKLIKGNFRVQKVEFQVTYDMAPSFRLIVFAHHEMEFIADSLKVDVVNWCHPAATVYVEPVFPSSEPGSDGKIVIRGLKNTLVGLLAIDKAVSSLGKMDLLTKTKILETIESHDLGCGPGGGRSTNIVLGNAGVVLLTNMYTPSTDLSLVPACEERTRRKREVISEMAQNYNGKEQECCKLGLTKHRSDTNCFDGADSAQHFEMDNSVRNCSTPFLQCCLKNDDRILDIKNWTAASATRKRRTLGDDFSLFTEFIEIGDEVDLERAVVVQSDFRETWFFLDRITGPDNREEFHVNLPHSITTWLIQAVSVSDQYGLCVAEPQSLVAFKNVFLQLNFPYSVVRFEQLEIQAVVFNHGGNRLPVVVYMHGVKDICSGAGEGEKSERQRIYVEPHSSKSVSFPVIPLKTGDYNIRVTALSPLGGDVVVKKLSVVFEGNTVENNIVVKLDPANEDYRRRKNIETPTFSDLIDQSRNLQVSAIKLEVSQNAIPGSESCVISAVGRKFVPVETILQNPDNLIRQSSGYEESNMLHLAPTVYTMRYLKVTRKMSSENERNGYDFIRAGYQRERNYRKTNGYYSAPGVPRPNSVWLTAFVMKVFCQVREFVNVDIEMILDGLPWLADMQLPDGSFVDSNPVTQTNMKGGLSGTLSTTAYVIIALQECFPDVSIPFLPQAVSFLESHMDELVDPHSIAVAAYALQLSRSIFSDLVFGKLQLFAKYEGNTLFWESGRGSHDIEVTGYGLLTCLLRNDMANSHLVVNWLNTKILTSGSFSSLQNTVMTLQALTQYVTDGRSPNINLQFNITSNSDRHLHKNFFFDEHNALIQKQMVYSKVGGLLFVSTAGYGVAFLKVKLKYNVPTPTEQLCKFDVKVNVTKDRQQPPPPQKNQEDDDLFHLNQGDVGFNDESSPDQGALQPVPQGISQSETDPENSTSVLTLQICIRHMGNSPTGRAIVDTGIISGFEPNRNDLEDLVNSKDHFIDNYEQTNRGVVIYLEKIPTQNYCFAFRVNRQFTVENTQISAVRVYDYYNPDEPCTQFYSPDNNSPLLRTLCEGGVCQCAEGGCPPYNPFAKVIQIQDSLGDFSERNTRAREELRVMICAENDYAWLGEPIEIRRHNGFLKIQFRIDTVLKQGAEERTDLVDETRELTARDNCQSAELLHHQTYLIMGKDGERYMDSEGNLRYRYLLDKSTSIHKWTSIRLAKDRFLQKALNYLHRTIERGECLD